MLSASCLMNNSAFPLKKKREDCRDIKGQWIETTTTAGLGLM